MLVAAGAHAGWNLLAKTAPGGGVAFVWLASVLGAAMLTPPALVLVAGAPPGTAAVAFMAGSGLIHAVYFACLQRGYRDGDLSLVYPVARGSGPVLATAGAVVAAGRATRARWRWPAAPWWWRRSSRWPLPRSAPERRAPAGRSPPA